MKIGIVTEYYYPLIGGITEHVHHYYLELKKLGHEPVIITTDAGKDPNVDISDINIIRIGKSIPIYSNGSIARIAMGFGMGQKMREIFKAEQFDVIHIHSPMVPMLPLLAQRYTNALTIGTFHTHFNSSIGLAIMQKRAQKMINSLHGRIAVSYLCIESMQKYFDTEFKIIPNGIDINKFFCGNEKIKKFDDGKKNIFFLSRLEPRNGLAYLIDAFNIIRKRRDDCRLIIGGDGPLKTYYKSMAKKFKEDIHFIGRINESRPQFYSTADIFCFPTTKASFGITILEAMASSKPVVAFTMPAYETIISSGKDGVLCGDFDVNNMANAIESLINNKELATSIGNQARITAENYSWSKITRDVLNYYDEVKQSI